ncbi:MAG: DNA recombination protein RmuC [Candidatus Spyradenecus sp.]
MQVLAVLLVSAIVVAAGLTLWAWHLARAYRAAQMEAQTQRQRAERAEITLAERERFAAQTRAEQQATLQASITALREQFTSLATRQLEASRAGLAEDNRTRFKALLEPLGAQLDAFRKAFDANREQQVANKASFDQALESLNRQTLQISADAEALTKALKSEAKTQGNWGELILENILAAAGLTEGVDYRLQAQELDETGQKLIPDVEILLPHNEVLLVDSKVSITAYANYVAATDDATRQKAAADHLASVRAHLKELADKNYPGRIRAAQNYILMFIPNEGSYLLALDLDRTLLTDAFRRHVLIVNPTTLLLCLQIATLLRSREAQSEKSEKIIAAATKLYEKFAAFTDSFATLGAQLDKAQDAYTKAKGQLTSGRGNFLQRLDDLKSLGVVTPKQPNDALQPSPTLPEP